jgi:hypothetical protein
MDAARLQLRDLRIRVDAAIRTADQLGKSDRQESSLIIDLVVAIHDELLDTDIGHEAWLLKDRGLVEDIAECIDGLVRLHAESFGLSLGSMRQRVVDILSRFDKVRDQLRAILLNKNVTQVSPHDRYITSILLRPSHQQLSGLSKQVKAKRPTYLQRRRMQVEWIVAGGIWKARLQLARRRRSRARAAAPGGRPQGRP